MGSEDVKMRYYIITLVRLEPHAFLGGMSAEMKYVGQTMDRSIQVSDLKNMATEMAKESKSQNDKDETVGLDVLDDAFKSDFIPTSFLEVSREDYEDFFSRIVNS